MIMALAPAATAQTSLRTQLITDYPECFPGGSFDADYCSNNVTGSMCARVWRGSASLRVRAPRGDAR